MALSQDVQHEVTIKDNGVVCWLRRRRYFDDAEIVAENNWRRVLEPGDTLTGVPGKVAAICNFVWTPAVIAAYQAARAAAPSLP